MFKLYLGNLEVLSMQEVKFQPKKGVKKVKHDENKLIK